MTLLQDRGARPALQKSARSGQRQALRSAGVIAAAILSLLVFFRFAVASGFNTLFGDDFDGLIEIAILEHWHNVFRGTAHWSQTFAFHPTPDTLGYNDGYLIFGAIYSVFRILGGDPLLASECVNITVKLIGFIGFYAFARRALAVPAGWAALGAAVFTVSNNSYVQGSHAQLFTVAFAPVLAAMLREAIVAVSERNQRAAGAWSVASALLFAAWLSTGFYMVWFFTVFCLLCIPLLAFAAGRHRLRTFVADLAACWRPLALAASVLGLALIPFMRLYLPKAAETGMHGVEEMAEYLLAPLDALYLGGNSLLYGPLQAWLTPALSPLLEHATGYTPVLLLAFLTGSAWTVWQRNSDAARIGACMALAACAFWLLALRIGEYSLWHYVYAYVPGAKAIRIVSRVQILLAWPVVTVAMVGLAAADQALRRVSIRHAALIGAAGLLVFVEQYNRQRVPALDRAVQMAWLGSMPAPPPECGAFFVAQPRAANPRLEQRITGMVGHNVDAMVLAEWLGLPTVNGFASLLPPGWNLLWIDRPDYLDRVRQYADQTGATPNLCSISLLTGVWNTTPFAQP